MSRVHQDSCIICGSSDLSPFLSTYDYFFSKERFELYRCRNCDFVFTQDAASEQEIGKYYKSQDYISHSDTKTGLINKLYHLSRIYMLSRKAKTVKKHTRSGGTQILDIGSGTGYFINYMQNIGWQVAGIEQDTEARDFSRKKFKLDVQAPDHLSGFLPEQFDAVSMWHVLEHVVPLDGYLKKIHKLLKKDGCFFVAVPNFRSYDAEYYKQYWAAYDVPRHLWHFSPRAFIRLIEKHGFRVTRIKKMPLDSFYISVISESYRNNGLGLITGFIIGFISFLISVINPKKASSVLYIVQKNRVV